MQELQYLMIVNYYTLSIKVSSHYLIISVAHSCQELPVISFGPTCSFLDQLPVQRNNVLGWWTLTSSVKHLQHKVPLHSVLFYIGIFFLPLVNVYHMALSMRSIIKTYSVRLHMEDSLRNSILLLWQLLMEMLFLFIEPTWPLDGVSRFLHKVEFQLTKL